jgi:transcriptional regulator with XRE-family HTH domain
VFIILNCFPSAADLLNAKKIVSIISVAWLFWFCQLEVITHMNTSISSLNTISPNTELSGHSDAHIGGMIRAHRMSRGLSLREVASAAGVSVGLLSQVERGIASPSLKALREVCAVIGLPMSRLFGEAETGGDPAIVRASERQRLTIGGKGMTKELLSQRPDIELQGMLVTVEPGGGSGAEPYAHDGEEIGMVLDGVLDIRIGEREHRLWPGDAFCFRSSTPHSFSNTGADPVRVLWVVSKSFY